MKILHYFLGFPPYRSGGLTKYAMDLMEAQAMEAHSVVALWPGRMRVVSHEISIKKQKNIHNIENYELVNPLPVPLDEGIICVDEYMRNCNLEIYQEFLLAINPDVIHIHTLMGLHQEFIKVANILQIRTIFTTHDYFGICPKVTLYRFGKVCEDNDDGRKCIQCNYNALSLKKIKIMQSSLYRSTKNFFLMRWLRSYHRKAFFLNEKIPLISNVDTHKRAKEYKKLRKYYVNMLESVDLIHFNSTVAEKVYNKYLTPQDSKVLAITHKNISDNRKVNKWLPCEKLRITYLAPAKPFKGFNILKSALDELWKNGKRDFELKVFTIVPEVSQYMVIQENGYAYSDLKKIFADTDVLVAPSVWYETFGFTVLEAISFGVPVIVSDHVGAKDIIENGGIVVEAGSITQLQEAILRLSVKKNLELRSNIENIEIKSWKKFMDENYQLYEGKNGYYK